MSDIVKEGIYGACTFEKCTFKGCAFFDCVFDPPIEAAEIERLKAENADLRRWKALDKPLTAAMGIAQADIERLTANADSLWKDVQRADEANKSMAAALHEIIALDHYPDATIARKALGLPTTDREQSHAQDAR